MITNEQLITGFRIMENYILTNYDYLKSSNIGLCFLIHVLWTNDLIDNETFWKTSLYIKTHRPSLSEDSEFYNPIMRHSLYYFPINDWDTRLAWVKKQIENLQK
jgi:hypothetical protein